MPGALAGVHVRALGHGVGARAAGVPWLARHCPAVRHAAGDGYGRDEARGPLVPHDILRVSGEEAVEQYLLHEIQTVYRSQRVAIDDKHIEIVVSQMLRKVKV